MLAVPDAGSQRIRVESSVDCSGQDWAFIHEFSFYTLAAKFQLPISRQTASRIKRIGIQIENLRGVCAHFADGYPPT
jgi:hypothetical protein